MFFPDSIDLSQPENYVLSIRLQEGNFSFSINLPGQNDVYAFRETSFKSDILYLEQVKRTIFDLNFLTQNFQRTYVQLVSPHYTLVPSKFFDDTDKKLFIEKTASYLIGQVLSEETLNGDFLVFDMEKGLYEFLSRNLFSPVFTHHTTSLRRLYNLGHGKMEIFSRVHLYFSGNQVDVFAVKNGTLAVMQSFVGQSENNLLYYVMNIWKRLEFDQLNDRLFVSGDSEKYEHMIPHFNKYIQFVEPKGVPSESYLKGEEAIKTPIDLLALIL